MMRPRGRSAAQGSGARPVGGREETTARARVARARLLVEKSQDARRRAQRRVTESHAMLASNRAALAQAQTALVQAKDVLRRARRAALGAPSPPRRIATRLGGGRS